MVTCPQSVRLIDQQYRYKLQFYRNNAWRHHYTLRASSPRYPIWVLNQRGCNRWVTPMPPLWDEVCLYIMSWIFKYLRWGIPDQTDSFSLSRSIWGLHSCSSIFLVLLTTRCFWSPDAVVFAVIASKWGSLTKFLLITYCIYYKLWGCYTLNRAEFFFFPGVL